MERNDIIKNLKENGNCYVMNVDFDIEEIEREVGFPITIRGVFNTDKGFVLEKKKEVSQ